LPDGRFVVSGSGGRVVGWPWLATLGVALSIALALVAQSPLAAADGLGSTTGQGSIAQATSDHGLVPAVSRASVRQADSNAEDRAGFGLAAVLLFGVALFILPARRGHLRFLRPAPAPGPGRSTQARAPPVAPVI